MNLKFFNPTVFPVWLREFFPRDLVLTVLAATCFILLGVIVVYADDGAVVPSTEASVIASILATVMPVIVLLISTLGPAAGTYIVAQIIKFLGITNQNKTLEVENKLRAVLHFCAVNALKFAYTKAGLPLGSTLSPTVIADALFYINDKNPDTVAALGLTDDDLTHILMTKVPEVADAAPRSSVPGAVAGAITGDPAPAPAAAPALEAAVAG